MNEPVDLVIHGGRIISPETVIEASIAIRGETIVAVGAPDAMPEAKETFDASGLHILPGAIDVHVHFRDPGYTHKEDFESGTAAAAFGGVTTVFDMPNTIPTVADGETLKAKHAIAASKAHVDYGLYAVLGEDTIDKVPELIEAGIIGFKCYMGNTFGRIPTPSTGAMLEAFERVAPTGKRISLHAETNSVMERRQKRLTESGRSDPLAHLASRPAVVAVEAVARAAILAEWTGARIHILHISSAAELGPLRDAKARGVDITGETCPHYLMLGEADYARCRGIIRVNPPVRESVNNEPLWAGLLDGTIDMIATDHAPHTLEEKSQPYPKSPSGLPAVENSLALLLDAVHQGKCTLSQVVQWMCDAPARVWDLIGKGRIAEGYDADLVLVDLHKSAVIRDDEQLTKSRWSPWHGVSLTGWPVRTFVLGRTVFLDGRIDLEVRGEEIRFDHSRGGYWATES